MTAKQMFVEAIHRLPDEATFDDIAAEVAFLAAIRDGEDDIKHGRIVSNAEMKQRIELFFR
jgi:hypothetical protein